MRTVYLQVTYDPSRATSPVPFEELHLATIIAGIGYIGAKVRVSGVTVGQRDPDLDLRPKVEKVTLRVVAEVSSEDYEDPRNWKWSALFSDNYPGLRVTSVRGSGSEPRFVDLPRKTIRIIEEQLFLEVDVNHRADLERLLAEEDPAKTLHVEDANISITEIIIP